MFASRLATHDPQNLDRSSVPILPSPQPVIAESSATSLVRDPEPLPSDVSSRRLRRGLVRLGGLVAIAVVVVTLGPGLGEVRTRFAHARPVWIVIACAFEVLSVLAYVDVGAALRAFKARPCTSERWCTSSREPSSTAAEVSSHDVSMPSTRVIARPPARAAGARGAGARRAPSHRPRWACSRRTDARRIRCRRRPRNAGSPATSCRA